MAIPFFLLILRLSNCQTVFEGMLWGLAVALFDLGLNASHDLFESRAFELFLIHRGFHALSLILIGAVLPALCSECAAPAT